MTFEEHYQLTFLIMSMNYFVVLELSAEEREDVRFKQVKRPCYVMLLKIYFALPALVFFFVPWLNNIE